LGRGGRSSRQRDGADGKPEGVFHGVQRVFEEMCRIVGRRILFSNEFVFGFICLGRIWTGLRAAPLGFDGFGPWPQQDQGPTPPARSRNQRFSTGLAAGSLFLLAVQRFAAQNVNGVLQTAGSNNKFVRDGNTYYVIGRYAFESVRERRFTNCRSNASCCAACANTEASTTPAQTPHR
jgi:hypothetical protein